MTYYVEIINDKVTQATTDFVFADKYYQGYITTEFKDYDPNNEKYKLINGEIVDVSNTSEYLEKQRAERNAVYEQEYLNKLVQYKSAIEQTRLFCDLNKLTLQERDTQIELLLNLINQAEELYDKQIGEG